MTKSNEKLLTLTEVAEQLRCSPSTVRRLIATGRIRAAKLTAGPGSARNLIPAAEIVRLLTDLGLPPELARDAAGSKP